MDRVVSLPQDARPIPGFDGYFATPDGHVWGLRRCQPRRLAQTQDHEGYPRVKVVRSDKRSARTKVAKLVALAFLPPKPTPSHELRHLDGNATNSSAENLAWGTHAENMADRERHGRVRRGERHQNARLTDKKIAEIHARCSRGERQVDVAAALGVSQSTVTRVWRRVAWKHIARPVQETP